MVSDNEEKELMFSVNKTLNTFTKLEFDIFLGDGHVEGAEADLKMKGSAFKRSCTIYKGNSIVAEVLISHTLQYKILSVGRCDILPYIRCSLVDPYM